MPSIYLLVGLPVSGKSYWVQGNVMLTTQNVIKLSSDDYLQRWADNENITYNEAFKKYIKKAEENFFEDLQQSIKIKDNILIDRTNISVRSRKRILDMTTSDYDKYALVFSCEEEEHKKRLLSRPGKIIPENVIETMKRNYQEPTFEEGYTAIYSFDTTNREI